MRKKYFKGLGISMTEYLQTISNKPRIKSWKFPNVIYSHFEIPRKNKGSTKLNPASLKKKPFKNILIYYLKKKRMIIENKINIINVFKIY